MRRLTLAPRDDWPRKVEDAGLIYHHTADGVYWDETVCYEFSMPEILQIERATADLHRLALAAAEHVIAERRYADFGVPEWLVPYLEKTWREEPPALYGRMDLAYDGDSLKLLEYNADTPTGLVEAAVAQWYWLQESSPSLDQFNSLHEKLVAKWTDLHRWGPVHFAHVNAPDGEDLMTVTYLRQTAEDAGIQTFGLAVEEIGWNGATFVDADDQPIKTLFKLYPWDWLAREPFGRHIPDAGVAWIEPAWKMLLGNKAILAVMYELEPRHPNLLPAWLDQPRASRYVKKPRLGREGANVERVDDDRTEGHQGPYGDEGFVYQAIAPMAGHYPVIGSWMIDQEPAGIGIREPAAGMRVTTNTSRFVPHRIG